MSRTERNSKPEKVVLQKTGTHVEVISGPYTKRQLREMLLSGTSLLSGTCSDREMEFVQSSLDPEDKRRIKEEEEKPNEKPSSIELTNLINTDLESNLIDLLHGKGISDDLINRILKYGVTDEVIRLLKALGLTEEEIARMVGMWEMVVERRADSEESCPSFGSSSKEYMSVDGFYLMSHLRNPLSKALGDVVMKKPWNPAEYLGHWLLNYKISQEKLQKQKEFDAQLQAERERRRIEVCQEPDVSEVDEKEEDWEIIEYEVD